MAFEPSTSRNIKNRIAFNINVFFKDKEAELINNECTRLGINRADLVRLCLKEYFDRQE